VKFVWGLVFILGASTVEAKPRKLAADPYAPIQVFELRVGIQPEWIVLEKMRLGSSFTHFLKFRRGKKTSALTVIPKEKFDQWSRDIAAMGKATRGPICAHPFEATVQMGRKRTVYKFCPANVNESVYISLKRSSTEMQNYVRRNDALKVKRSAR